MSSIKSLNEALDRLEIIMQQAGVDDTELKAYIVELHTEKQNLVQKVNKLRQSTLKSNTISSMHSKLTDALRE